MTATRAPARLRRKTITAEWLVQQGACRDHVIRFRAEFGESAAITPSTIRRASVAGLDFDWAAEKLLTAPARKAYEDATATTRKAYDDARATAWKAYDDATATAWKAYVDARATAWKAYEDAKATARKAYVDATATALISILFPEMETNHDPS